MRQRLALFSVLCLPLVGGVALGDGLGQRLHGALAKLPHAQTRLSACVVDLRTGQTVFELNADASLTPASTMKVFAMTSALHHLGPDFRYRTILAGDGRNLYVVGDGDPAFGDEKVHAARNEPRDADLVRWTQALRELGVTRVAGDLVIDESVFDAEWRHPSWERGDLDNWYAAPIGGLNYNGNCVDVTIKPQGKGDGPVSVSVQPRASVIKIINAARSGGAGPPVLNHDFDSFEYKLSGRTNKTWTFGSVSFPDPGLLFADTFRAALEADGVTLDGGIVRRRVRQPDGSLPPGIVPLTLRDTPIADVLARSGKDSQNLFAECLMKRAGHAWAVRHGLPDPRGSWDSGRLAILQMANEAGLATEGLVVADGSGLSRQNACTARQLTTLLAWAHRRPWGSLFRESLALAGVDGSLRKRMTNAAGEVYAKTGTMTGIRALTGYVLDETGPRFTFAVVFNGYKGPSGPYKDIQDKVCRILIDEANPKSSGR